MYYFPGGFCVLMPVYSKDSALLFKEAITSVMSNSLQPDQFIIVADGPLTIDLLRVIQKVNSDYMNFIEIIMLPKNLGLSGALNEGLKRVRFPWVARADADDFNLPNRFQDMAKLLALNPKLELMSSSILEIDERKNPVCIRRVPETESEIRKFIKYRNPFNHMAVVYSLSAVLACGGYPKVHLMEDYALWSIMIAQGARVGNSHDILVHATAGSNMYKRRAGLLYVKSEIDIQKILVRNGFKSILNGFISGFFRSIIFISPNFIRALTYTTLLREKKS